MTQRLAAIVLERWDEIDGYAASRNMPPLPAMPLARFVSFAYWWITREADSKDVAKFRNALWRPPVNETRPLPPESPWSAANETSAFAALKAQAAGARST